MTRPSLTSNGLTPAERERYEAQPGLAPDLRPPGQPGGMEPIGAILARLKALQAGGKPLGVPTHLGILPMVSKRAKTGKEQRKRDQQQEVLEVCEPGETYTARRNWLRDSPVQGYPGQFMEESAKEAE